MTALVPCQPRKWHNVQESPPLQPRCHLHQRCCDQRWQLLFVVMLLVTAYSDVRENKHREYQMSDVIIGGYCGQVRLLTAPCPSSARWARASGKPTSTTATWRRSAASPTAAPRPRRSGSTTTPAAAPGSTQSQSMVTTRAVNGTL